jgi:predicted Zn-dependent protease
MIGQMDDAFAKARAKGDKDAMRQNSAAQVALITPLIEQTKDEKIRNKYKKWKAQLVLRAARNEDDRARRSQYLTEAQNTFTELMKLSKEGEPEYDNLRYQLALVSYELKDYKKVQQEMGQLIADGKLGPPDVRETNPADGTDTFKENPVYWEGLLRFMQSNWQLSKTDASPEMAEAIKNAQATLKTLYINRGKNVGGDRLRDEYAQLKMEMLPGWDESKASATQPAAAAK